MDKGKEFDKERPIKRLEYTPKLIEESASTMVFWYPQRNQKSAPFRQSMLRKTLEMYMNKGRRKERERVMRIGEI